MPEANALPTKEPFAAELPIDNRDLALFVHRVRLESHFGGLGEPHPAHRRLDAFVLVTANSTRSLVPGCPTKAVSLGLDGAADLRPT
jgi:hypothetical protein